MKKWFCRLILGEDGRSPERRRLRLLGLSEQQLRRLSPDERVARLEAAGLDPYDYIFLCC